MSTNIANQSPFLRTTRLFPEKLHELVVEANKAYVDTSNAVNQREISIYPVNKAALNGQNWYFQGAEPFQGFRQVYTFTSTNPIPHGLNFSNVNRFTHLFGQFTDDTTGNWYGLISSSNVPIAGQISFYIDPTNIIFLVGAGAPPLSTGTLVLEWVSNP